MREKGGGFTSIMSGVADIIILSVAWGICCIPVITIPLVTAALYYSTVKSIRKGRGYAFRTFFEFLKEYWKQGLWLGLAYFGITLVVVLNYYAAGQMKDGSQLHLIYQIESLGLCMLLVFIAIYSFPIFSRFQYSVWQNVKVAFLMSLRHIFSSVILGVITIIMLGLMMRFLVFTFVFPGIWALLISFRMEAVFRKYMKEPEEGTEIPWYWE